MASAPSGGMGSLETLAGVSAKASEPLAVSPPSFLMLLNYPLFAANVRVLCDKDSWRSRASSSPRTMCVAIHSTFKQEGWMGVYRGGHLYILHQVLRDSLRFVAERALCIFEGRGRAVKDAAKPATQGRAEGGDAQAVEAASSRNGYFRRLAAKYLIDAMCYPILLASTRYIILHDEKGTSYEHICHWCKEEGAFSLFGGLAASLLSTALDEIMDTVLAWSIDWCAADSEVEVADRLLLKASGSSVVTTLTAPVNHIGVIQRCQSRVSCNMLEPQPVFGLARTLPWRGAAYQFCIFGGIMALNVKLIQWKIMLQKEQAEGSWQHDTPE